MKHGKKVIISILVILVIICIVCAMIWYFKKEDEKRTLEEERKIVLELSQREMKAYGYHGKEYDVVIENENEDGTYDVRMRKDQNNMKIYYHVDPKQKQVTMVTEKTFPENKQSK